MIQVRRGEIYYADLNRNSVEGSSVQRGLRPVVVVQNDVGNRHSPTTIVVPLTSKHKRNHLPTHVQILADKENGLRLDSVALSEQVQPIDKTCLGEKLGIIRDMNRIDNALSVSIGLAPVG